MAEKIPTKPLWHQKRRLLLFRMLGDWQFNTRLRVLRIRGNRLESLEGANLSANSLLRELDISCNAIESLDPLPYLKCLDTLDVSHNLLRSLKGIERSSHLVVIRAEVRPSPVAVRFNAAKRTSYKPH